MKHRATVAIAYGFCEGPRLGSGLRRALGNAGFSVTSDVQNADVIIAHSAGCYIIPSDCAAHTVVLVGAPFWSGKPLALRFLQKVGRDILVHVRAGKFKAWCAKTLWNGVYFWRLRRNARMLFGMNGHAVRQLTSRQLLVLRNRNDAFCAPDIYTLPMIQTAAFVSLPGEHDDLWGNPNPYARLVRAIANLQRLRS